VVERRQGWCSGYRGQGQHGHGYSGG
jgi:hypothetical protein